MTDLISLHEWNAILAAINTFALAGHVWLHRRRPKADLTRAECVECAHAGPAAPVSAAMADAKEHRALTGHQVMVVKV